MKHALTPPRRRMSTRTKAFLTGGLIALGIAGVGSVVFAAFTATTAASGSAVSGTVTLSGISTDGAGNRLTVAATSIAPGDTVQRAVTIQNTGSVDLSDITLTTDATTSSLLDTDTVTGLQMSIDRCSVAWTESAFPYTYSCAGTTTTVLASTPVIGTNRVLSNLDLTASATNDLRVTLALPGGAGNELQGQTSAVNYTFTATQRTGTAR
jgi:spore coat-associated protein N